MMIMIFFALFAFVLSGCAKKKNDISDVDTTSYVMKSELTGCSAGKESGGCAKTYSAVKTLMNANEELDSLWVIPGFHADLGFVQFFVTENELQIRRVGEVNRDPAKASLVAAFPIVKHFDIKREDNSFNEQTNRIVEDTRRPWQERDYMRVDWGRNSVKSTSIPNMFNTEITEEGAQVVSPLKIEKSKDGTNLLSFNVDAAITQKEFVYVEDMALQVDLPGALRTQIKNTFQEVKKSDYRSYEMSNADFNRFGYFRTYENFINPDKGFTISGRKTFANRFNVCENNASTKGRSCATNKIVYVLNKDYPEEYRKAARDSVAAWNKAFQKALDRTDAIVVLDESVQPEIGDTRYSMIAGINEKVPTGLLGVSQTSNNPNSGETLMARATIYTGAVKIQAGLAAEQFDVLTGSPAPGGGMPLTAAMELETANSQLATKIKNDMKARQTILKTKDFKLFGKDMARPTLNLIKTKLGNKDTRQGPLMDTLGRATARREFALQDSQALSFLKFNDPAFKWDPANKTSQEAALRNTVNFASNEQMNKIRHMSLEARGIHTSDYIEPAVELYVRKFIAANPGKPKDVLRAQLIAEVRYLVFYTTLLHEMGHNFGLRHNFQSSSDRKNYTVKWNDLEKQKQQIAATNPNDPRIGILTLEQESYDFSSVMDYTASFHESHGGTGPYDDAAIRYGYNTSINRDGDPITGTVRGYKFCTDHQVGEELMCQRWDKGTNVSLATARLGESYNRNYVWKNFRRDRERFGDVMSYFNGVLVRYMMPMRQVGDEFLYQFITSGGSNGPCGIAFIDQSIANGEVANICDANVQNTYAQAGIDLSDWSNWIYLLLNDQLNGLRMSPANYAPVGFADLIFANYQSSQFFVNVLGATEPALYLTVPSSQAGIYMMERMPNAGNADDSLRAYLQSQGYAPAEVEAQLQAQRGNLVDLKPGPQAKYLLSLLTRDGSFDRAESIGYLFDKLAATIMMGYRGLPVEKYWRISLNTNMFFSPLTKSVTTGLFGALIDNDPNISVQPVTTAAGEERQAVMPAALDLNTKFYGLIIAASDLVSDQNQEYSHKLRICNETQFCQNPFKLPEVSFRGSDPQDFFKAVQTITQDSVAFNIVAKGDLVSKERDQADIDIKNPDALRPPLAAAIAGGGTTPSAETKRKALTDLMTRKAPALGQSLAQVYAKGAIGGNPTIWQLVLDQGNKPDEANPNLAIQIKDALPGIFGQVAAITQQQIGNNAALLKEITDAQKLVNADMTSVNGLTTRLIASPIIFQNATEALKTVEADAKFVRLITKMLNVE
jgi:hypothetical protein